tara:strand:- start:325 stop:1458 length:1134 start_codon:yes stop_codon:yes gene_type:complete
MKKILCLSRAPLNYKAGIPVYCKSFYSNIKNAYVEFINIDLTSSIERIYRKKINNEYLEITFPTFFRIGTLGLSLEYFKYIFLNISKFNYVHLQHPDPFSAICILLSMILNRKKLIVTWHADVYKKYFIFFPIFIIVDFFVFLIAEKIIFLTQAHIQSSLLGKLSFFRKKTVIIPALLKENIFYPKDFNKISFPKEDEFFYLISIGRLVSYKGYEYALEALSKINFKYKYFIIGKGPLKEKLKNRAKELKISDKVEILGEVSEKKKCKYLMKSHVFLFPSITKSEAYGLVQLEAMAFSLPVVNTFLNNGVNSLMPKNLCLTVKPRSSYELMEAINKIRKNENLFRRLNESSFKRLVSLDRKKVKKNINKLFINFKQL